MLFEVSEIKEKKIKSWEKQHKFNKHFDISDDELSFKERDYNIFTYIINPSMKNPQKYHGIVRCNLCNEVFQFASKAER